MIFSKRLHPGINLGETDPEAHEAAESALFGFWIFLMTDLVIFAVLFATYAAMSTQGVAEGPSPAEIFDLKSPFIETMLLLASSFTFGMASISMKYGEGRGLVLWLGVTGLLGAAFVGMEIYDFSHLAFALDAAPQRSGFLSSYWLLVGTHGVHVSVAILWMLVMFLQMARFGLNRHVKLRLLCLALFWHMLDIVWIGIFSFVYLFGVVA